MLCQQFCMFNPQISVKYQECGRMLFDCLKVRHITSGNSIEIFISFRPILMLYLLMWCWGFNVLFVNCVLMSEWDLKMMYNSTRNSEDVKCMNCVRWFLINRKKYINGSDTCLSVWFYYLKMHRVVEHIVQHRNYVFLLIYFAQHTEIMIFLLTCLLLLLPPSSRLFLLWLVALFVSRIEAPSSRVEQVTFLPFREKHVWKFVIIAKFHIKLYVYYFFFVILLI